MSVNKQITFILLAMAGLVTGIGIKMVWISPPVKEENVVERHVRLVGEIHYVQDPRTGICFSVTDPGKTYSSTAPVECSNPVLKAIEQDK
jgi:hypothetical protein